MWRSRIVVALATLAGATVAHGQLQAQDTAAASVVQRFVDGFNVRDLDAMVATVADDVVFISLPTGDTIAQGSAGVRAHYGRNFERLASGFTVHIATRITDGAFVTDFEQFYDGGGKPEGQATWIYYVASGRIQRAWALRQVQLARQ